MRCAIFFLFYSLSTFRALCYAHDLLEWSTKAHSQEQTEAGIVTADPPSQGVSPSQKSPNEKASVAIGTNVDLWKDESATFLRPRLSMGSWSTPNNVTEDTSCAGQRDCQSCVARSSWCHWCEKQNTCHSKGSFYGCFSGAQCAKNDTVDPNDEHGCAAHQTCGECATASRFCHWCGHDQACHAIGSVYGCTVGVDCFSNDRCKRQKPEKIQQHVSFRDLNPLPVAIVSAAAMLVCCCASVCFCICRGVKGAYDDLVISTNPAAQDGSLDPLLGNEHVNDESPSGIAEPETQESSNGRESIYFDAQEEGEAPIDGEDPDTANEGLKNEGDGDGADGQSVDEIDGSEADPLLVEDTVTSAYSRRRSIRPRPPRHMQRMYNACRGCYIVTLLMMFSMVLCSVIYYPQIPVYNICNDDVAWKSIIDSMLRMHTQADFEILASLSNPNHISVALDNGTGFFHHNGKFAGSFTIPPFTAEAMSITDILIIAHLTPGTWDAVQIAEEYSMGKLILHVNTSVVIRVPALADFTYEGHMDDIVVNVNEINDRSLCACPSWDEAKNHSDRALDFENDEPGFLSLDLPLLREP